MDQTCSSLGGNSPSFRVAEPTVDTGTCMANPSETLPEPVRSNARTLCAPPAMPPMCTGEPGVCLAETMGGDYCIIAPGDQECPAGSAYSQREVVFTTVDDSRGCGGCTCGNITGTCTGTANLYSQAACGGTVTQVPADGSCYNFSSPDTGFLTVNSVDASCRPIRAQPSGRSFRRPSRRSAAARFLIRPTTRQNKDHLFFAR